MQDPTLDLSVINAMGDRDKGMDAAGPHVLHISRIIFGANYKDVVSSSVYG